MEIEADVESMIRHIWGEEHERRIEELGLERVRHSDDQPPEPKHEG
jgi:hypothetical protein